LKKHLFNETILNDWEKLAQDIDEIDALIKENEVKS